MHLHPLLALLLVTTAGLQAAAPSIDSVLASYAAAVGAEKIAQLQSVVDTRIIHSSGSDMIKVSYAKRPFKFRSELSGAHGRVITAYDGTKAWCVIEKRGDDPKPISLESDAVDSLRKQAVALLDGLLLDAKARALPIDLVGEEFTEESPLILRVTETDQSVYRVKLDPKTFLPLSLHSTLKGRSCLYRFSNYTTFDGLSVPLEILTLIDGREVQDSRLCSFRPNVELDDALFIEPPLKATPPTPSKRTMSNIPVASVQGLKRGASHP